MQLKIAENLKPDRFNNKYIAKIQAVDGASATGKVLLHIQKDSIFEALTIDAILLVSADLQNIPKPLNPHQFDYSKYMKTLGVHHQIRIKSNSILKLSRGQQTLRGRSEKFRNSIIKKLEKSPIDLNERAILQALVLGQKRDVSKELYDDYSAAGAVHILAVSGLHVGILFFILSFLFKVFGSTKWARFLQNILIIICLWGFAYLTGLSPSVTRAVTMFSFFAFAQSINRKTNAINTLFLSYFVLLCFNPLWVFHVGFQMSYLAVLSILLIQPWLYKLYRPRFYLDRLFWNILTVSFAVQFGLAPLSIYYFNQFPGLFFITNLVILPLLAILLGGGILVIILSVFDWLPNELALTYNYLLKNLNEFIQWIASQEAFIFREIHFSETKLISCYLVLGVLLLLRKEFSYKGMILTLVSFSMVVGVFIIEKTKLSENELIILHKSRISLIAQKENLHLRIFRRESTADLIGSYPIKGYKSANDIASFSEESTPSFFKYKDKNVLILDSLGVYPKSRQIDVIVLTNSPRVNLERLIDSIQPKLIIADGSNYRSYVARWTATCINKKLPFHHTGNKGAFILE